MDRPGRFANRFCAAVDLVAPGAGCRAAPGGSNRRSAPGDPEFIAGPDGSGGLRMAEIRGSPRGLAHA
jgi:hypothetical protein